MPAQETQKARKNPGSLHSTALGCESVRNMRIPPRGLEKSHIPTGKLRNAPRSGAKSGALSIGPFLAMMIDAAPKLTETEKNAVLVMVQTFLGSKSASALSDAADEK